ncbi:MAG: MMPL family transporter, partial [Proteobacteria bacterium]|nr:MMPL family transporter [Pseudomonadota bacterium]
PDANRALMLVRMKAAGLDLTAQDQADAAIRAAFAVASPGPARLLVSGPAIFARDAERSIRSDVRLLSIASTVLVAGLLLLRFRSPLVLAVIAVPVMLAVAVAAVAVQLIFGFVQGTAFGFGMTMLGVTVDYPVLLIGHRKRGEAASGTLHRIGPTFNLAVASASLGLVGMLRASLPGLVQVGVFAVVGVLAAAAATRWLLPPLIVAADLAPVSAGSAQRLLRLEHLRRWRVWGLVPVAAAALVLVLYPPRLERDLANLSPVPAEGRALDQELRRQLGAPEVGQIAVVRGASVEAVLRREETLLPVLDRLAAGKVIDGAELAARYMPSHATQRARQAALPDGTTLAERLGEAGDERPFRPEAFAPFRQDVEAARARQPLSPADIASPLLAARVQPLLFQRDGVWYGLIVPRGINDTAALGAAFAGVPDVTYVDIGRELNGMLADSTANAWTWLSWSAAATIVALVIGLRDMSRVARVIGALAASGVVTVAVLALTGARLSLIHIVTLQFAAGVGLDYALFFARTQVDEEERARTLRTLVTCNAMTLMTFGLLTFCETALLRTIGLPVAVGTFSALVFGFLFAGPRPEAE